MYKNMLFVNYPDEALDNSFIYPIYLERELARWFGVYCRTGSSAVPVMFVARALGLIFLFLYC